MKEDKRWPWKRDASQTLEVIAWGSLRTMTAAAKNLCEIEEATVRSQLSQVSPGEAQRSELAMVQGCTGGMRRGEMIQFT